jgi:SAM-dependent methyltransferase
MDNLKIDLGCGLRKKEGTLGIDFQAYPGVDYVLNIQTDPLPFPNKSVKYVHSSHFLEHIENPISIFQEISRVCADGAQLEFWTPYGWSNPAFIFDHKLFYNEDHYLHLCVWHFDVWEKVLNARWLLKEIIYVVDRSVLVELYRNQISLDFALKYYKGCVVEFGVVIEVHHEYKGEKLQPRKTFALARSSKRYPVQQKDDDTFNSVEIEQAINWFTATEQERHRFPNQNFQLELEQLESLPSDTRAKIEQLQIQLQHHQTELQQSRDLINAMQASKLWQLRNGWFKFEKLIGKK